MADWNEYFSKTRPPSNLDEAKRTIQDFAIKHRQLGRNIVLVTSGGTTVPIESNTVRFVDNFSQGTRGAASAEYFLLHGYAVIFLHRQRSFEPFCRHFEGHNALDLLELQLDTSGAYRLTVDDARAPGLQDVVRRYKEVQGGCLLLKIGFMTLSDYLFLLHASAEALSPLGGHVMFYLAAAVSDFYIPENEMNEHKIQSSDKSCGFSLNMSATPKMLSPLVMEWAKQAFVVSFKLETDMNIISRKAREALQKYNHQVVIANMLQTRRKTVILVTASDEVPIWMSDQELEVGKEIEEKIVAELFRRHNLMITGQSESNQQQQQQHHHQNQHQQQQQVTTNNPLVPNNITFSPQQPQQYQAQSSINAPTTPSTPSTPSTMPGLAPINVYPGSSNNPNTTTKLQLLHLKSTSDADMNNEILNNNILKRSVSAKEDTGGLTAEMQEFIREFKSRRVHLGYTQDDVGRELSALNGPTYSQSFISRFEGKQLGMKAAERMRPILESWIQSKEEDANNGNKFQKKRRKRTSFPPEYIQILNDYFQKNPKPSNEEMQEIAKKIQLDTTTVKVWFCNKKQSIKRLGHPANRNNLKVEIDGKRKRKGDAAEIFPLSASHPGMKTLLPVSTPTGQITVPFFISQDGNAIPIVSASAVANSNVQTGAIQTSGHHLNSTMQQPIVLSQVPILTSMAVVNNGSTDGSQPQIIPGGRLIPSGSVLQIPGSTLTPQGHLQDTHANINDATVIIAPNNNSAIQTGNSTLPAANTSLAQQQQSGNQECTQNGGRILMGKSALNSDFSEKDLESDEVCVSDESKKSEKLMPRAQSTRQVTVDESK